ncbi:SCAN domain-containing protein 3-like [Tachypleus tridentatus]|uniref:SCAN domain-containing protein 3-like n=1 Tax=Tachypleus tridentatus TaxID=6853 RepID=UPI003FCFA96E
MHRQHLVSKKLRGRLYDSLTVVTKAINFIKSRSFQDRLFRQLCDKNEKDFERLVTHTEIQFSDPLDMNIPDWVTDPFEVNVSDVDITLQEYVNELHSDITAQARFKRDKHYFWISSEIANKFPQLWEKTKLYFIAFPISYLVETGFSHVIYLLSKIHNRLDVVKRSDFRLSLATLQPDIQKLSSVHQAQGSH